MQVAFDTLSEIAAPASKRSPLAEKAIRRYQEKTRDTSAGSGFGLLGRGYDICAPQKEEFCSRYLMMNRI